MVATVLSWTAVLIVAITSTSLFLNRDWRWDIGLLSIQYLGVAILVAQHWPLGMAAVKLVTGWMATATLGMTLTAFPLQKESEERFWPQGLGFRLFMVGMIIILAIAVTPRLEESMTGIGAPVFSGTILLTGIGLLHLGTSSQISRVIFGLLTVLAGFEILYAAVEGSILVAALLSVVNLGLGLVGAYLLNGELMEEGA